uniref:Uncharacterized protein n=1 Tax=viral metagenome TaxID=1070528 RepID=A0A6C0BUY6_9ZZZZ
MSIKKRNMKKSKKKCHMGGSTERNELPDVVYESDLKKELKTKHEGLVGLVISLIKILSTGVTYVVITSKNAIAKVLRIDMSSITNFSIKEFLAKQISELRDLSNDAVTQNNLRELSEKVGVYAGIAINVATPVIKQVTPQIIEITFEGLGLLGQALIKLALDLAGSVPVLGSAIEGIRVVDDAVKSGEALVDANLQLITKIVDSYGVFVKRFLSLLPSSDQLTPAYLTSLIEKQQAEAQAAVAKVTGQENIPMATATRIYGGGIKKASEIKKRIKKSIARFHRTNKRKTRRHKRKY